MSKPLADETTASNLLELRRGTVVLASLAALRTPSYGYALLDELGASGLDVDANTLYPLLRRLEKQGLLASEWNTDEARPRKFYRTTPAGERLAATLTEEWARLDRIIRGLDTGRPKTAPSVVPASAPKSSEGDTP